MSYLSIRLLSMLFMSEFMQIMLTASLTILGGIIVFVVGQFIQRLIIEPIQEQRRLIGRICHTLIVYRHIAKDEPNSQRPKPTSEQIEIVRTELRELAARLRATLTVLPWYGFYSCVKLARKKVDVMNVSRQLMRWELFMSATAKNEAIEKIAKVFDLHIEDEWTEFCKMMGDDEAV